MSGVEQHCGAALTVHPVGNAPIAHLELPDTTRVFFYRMLHVDGLVQLGDGVSDYAWLTKLELASRLDQETATLTAEMFGPFA